MSLTGEKVDLYDINTRRRYSLYVASSKVTVTPASTWLGFGGWSLLANAAAVQKLLDIKRRAHWRPLLGQVRADTGDILVEYDVIYVVIATDGVRAVRPWLSLLRNVVDDAYRHLAVRGRYTVLALEDKSIGLGVGAVRETSDTIDIIYAEPLDLAAAALRATSGDPAAAASVQKLLAEIAAALRT